MKIELKKNNCAEKSSVLSNFGTLKDYDSLQANFMQNLYKLQPMALHLNIKFLKIVIINSAFKLQKKSRNFSMNCYQNPHFRDNIPFLTGV